MELLQYFIITILLTSSVFAELNVDNVVFAINCGGDTFHDSRGVEWEKVSFNFFITNFLLIG